MANLEARGAMERETGGPGGVTGFHWRMVEGNERGRHFYP